jgi:hypothetical protein
MLFFAGLVIAMISGIIGMTLDIKYEVKDCSIYWMIGVIGGALGATFVIMSMTK